MGNDQARNTHSEVGGNVNISRPRQQHLAFSRWAIKVCGVTEWRDEWQIKCWVYPYPNEIVIMYLLLGTALLNLVNFNTLL